MLWQPGWLIRRELVTFIFPQCKKSHHATVHQDYVMCFHYWMCNMHLL